MRYASQQPANGSDAVSNALELDSSIGNHRSRDGTAASTFIETFRETDDHIVAILDEVDVLEDETLLWGSAIC
ncbi:hypothetical protein [Natronorubrum sulfidifaciens]|uniref:Orc1/cdc6 family replication initiation protein n=1 Tax=Natronorubrum sulfidifaciens JCM 14089 TaxID=1230460 RepID=L9WFP4_9EURY|nr:hypothetical protein [Natronorubrum sulfidifaciens]ELY48086.1 hypothetical protein C495_01390 [Natronorubrum sulfidifaciens JCM 14089]